VRARHGKDQDQAIEIAQFRFRNAANSSERAGAAPSTAPIGPPKFPENREFFAIQQGMRIGHPQQVCSLYVHVKGDAFKALQSGSLILCSPKSDHSMGTIFSGR
jgi:hypothetical protein